METKLILSTGQNVPSYLKSDCYGWAGHFVPRGIKQKARPLGRAITCFNHTTKKYPFVPDSIYSAIEGLRFKTLSTNTLKQYVIPKANIF